MNIKRLWRLMELVRWRTLFPRMRTTKSDVTAYKYPYLLWNLTIDQGSQFTSAEYINLLKNNEIQISMDGRGRALDDIFIERLWRSVKQEYVD